MQIKDYRKDLISFSGTVEGGLRFDAETRSRMCNPSALESYGYKVYSQNDEDGIIHEIFRRIGTTNKKFIEFGVQDGLESNTHLLLFYGWSGLWIEGSSTDCKEIETKFRPVIKKGQLRVENVFITRENINELFIKNGFEGEIDLLSIDIDGNDWHVWDAIEVVDPRVVVVEYNGKFPPDLEWCQAYDASHVWNGTDWHGASLKAFELLGRKKGYQLVGTNLRGANAFFVREDVAEGKFYEPSTAEAVYNPLRNNLVFVAGHPSKYCLAIQEEGLGILNYEKCVPVRGFHLIESDVNGGHVWMSELTGELKFLMDAGTQKLLIPYCLPEQLIVNGGLYQGTIECSAAATLRFSISNPSGVLEIEFEEKFAADTPIVLKITVPKLWSPAELMDSEDTRMLGLDILIGAVEMV